VGDPNRGLPTSKKKRKSRSGRNAQRTNTIHEGVAMGPKKSRKSRPSKSREGNARLRDISIPQRTEDRLNVVGQQKSPYKPRPHSRERPSPRTFTPHKDEECHLVRAKPYITGPLDMGKFAEDDGMQEPGSLYYKDDISRWSPLYIYDLDEDFLLRSSQRSIKFT
jgi:hypothetical protein